MTEPDVTLTDYGIALECAILCVLLARLSVANAAVRRWSIVLFASIGAGALFGGTVHGFFLDESSLGNRILWPATLLALGVTSMAMWFMGASAALREPRAGFLRRAAVAALVVYAAIVLFVDQRFVVAIAMYLPATVFLLVILCVLYARHRMQPLAIGIAGLLLTFVAAAVQQLRIAVHPVYFNHNALYHVVQGVALAMIYVGARWLTTNTTVTAS
ncbi:MAG: DUF6962 family protein [Gemmatimonadaceae bacterium]